MTVLTDKLLFDSGSATLEPAGYPLLVEIAQPARRRREPPVDVEGYTDNIPIQHLPVPQQLGALDGRATTVVQYLISQASRATVSAPPAMPSCTDREQRDHAGRQKNRRVEIVFERINPNPPR